MDRSLAKPITDYRKPPAPPRRGLLRSAAGYSIVSIIVSLQLTMVIGLIAMPKMGTFFTQYQLMSAANQLGFDIARARMQAVGQNKYVHIKIPNSTQYVRETSSDGTTWSNSVTKTLPASITASPTTGEVRFDRRGFITVKNDTITLTSTISTLKTITTNLTGRVTIG
jgi:Tfp pilus assembly protein FimT